MMDKSKRHSLAAISAGIVASFLPLSVWSSSKDLSNARASHIGAYEQNGTMLNVKVSVSTLGMGTAVTTIRNDSNATVTVTKLNPEIVQHNNMDYYAGAALGRAGVTLKPGQRRILIAPRVKTRLAMA